MAFRPKGWHKYGAKKIEHEGQRFDSKIELKRWLALQKRQEAGEICGLSRQVVYELQPKFDAIVSGALRHYRALRYVLDFEYYEQAIDASSDEGGWRHVVEDIKGFQTYDNGIKEKLFRYKYPDVELRIIKR